MGKTGWRRTTIIIVLIAYLVLLWFCFFLNGASGPRDYFTNSAILGNVYYFTQIVAAIAIVLGGVIGVWQYTLTSRAERAKLNTDRIQRAINMSEYYKDNILRNYIVIKYVYERSGLLEIVEKVDADEMSKFDEYELNELFSKEDQDKLEEMRNGNRFLEAVLEADKIYALDLDIKSLMEVEVSKESQETSIKLNGDLVIHKFMANIVTETLNSLEFFAMHFTHGTADETVVYQSLHQTYQQMVHGLYYNIAVLNKPNQSKFFTNIIELYQVWAQRNQEEMEEIVNAVRSHESKGSTVDKF